MAQSAPHSRRHLGPGDKLGKYDLIRQIAVGGMAELYLARTLGIEGFEKLVVVKRILPQYRANERFVAMFLNEARLAATLQHPNIAQVYDIGNADGEYFFSMEYVHGEDLGRTIAAAADAVVGISLDAALTLVAGLCAGLHYAHSKAGSDGRPLAIVHRDVSPSNVLVSYDGAVKLVDFGIARAGGSPSTRPGLKGKVAYMSPEQCRGNEVLDRRSDLYSVGAILYELTTGRLPFAAETEYGVLNQIVNLDVPAPSQFVPDYPRGLEVIVLRALARDPAQRYFSALELQTAIEDFAHEHRLRISPLVLSRVMSTLFPQALEEWDHAKAQGAFFVEQHVVRTLIEKTGDTGKAYVTPAPGEDTTVSPPPSAAPPSARLPTERVVGLAVPVGEFPHVQYTPIPAGTSYDVRPPTPLPHVAAVPAPVVSAMRTPVPRPMPAGGLPTLRVAPLTDLAMNHQTSIVTLGRRTRRPWLPVALGAALAAGIALAIALDTGSDGEQVAQTAAVPPAPAPALSPPLPPPATVAPPAPVPVPTPESAPAEVVADEPEAAPAEPAPKTAVSRKASTKRTVRPAAKKRAAAPKRAPRTTTKPEPKQKDPAWNADSPFMPVRPGS